MCLCILNNLSHNTYQRRNQELQIFVYTFLGLFAQGLIYYDIEFATLSSRIQWF